MIEKPRIGVLRGQASISRRDRGQRDEGMKGVIVEVDPADVDVMLCGGLPNEGFRTDLYAQDDVAWEREIVDAFDPDIFTILLGEMPDHQQIFATASLRRLILDETTDEFFWPKILAHLEALAAELRHRISQSCARTKTGTGGSSECA